MECSTTIRAYMDDVTVTGPALDAERCFLSIIRSAEQIGLSVNNTKTVVSGVPEIPAPPKSPPALESWPHQKHTRRDR